MSLCPYAKKCGGCQLQNLTYPEQLHMKEAKLIRLLGRFGRVSPILGMDDPTHYRAKVQAAFRQKSGAVVSGVYQSSSGHIVDVDACLLEDAAAAPILRTIRKLCASMKVRPYDIPSRKGFLRHVLIRVSRTTDEVMVVLVTAKGVFREERSFVNELLRRHPEITTLVRNINPTDTPLFLGKESIVLYGAGYITDRLCGLEFRISPRSFYQVNPTQTEILYATAWEFASLTGTERVLDAYCGTGTIGLSMAAGAREVVGVEVNRDAVADSRENAKRNNIANASFHAADAGAFMRETARAGEHFDVVVTDPPRAGCSQAFLRCLLTLAPDRVVYVSCNPETLARDLFTLTKSGYQVKRIQPVDMFPHTNHVETVVLLSREKVEHQMKLYAEPFEKIKNGQKTIELRLWDEKRQKIKIGDTIVFTNTTNGEKLKSSVLQLHRFNSFEALYQSLPLLKCGYTEENIDSANASDMEAYYSAEDQTKYGVVGIELSPPSQITDEYVVLLNRRKTTETN